MRHLADFTKVDLNTNAPQQQCSTLLTLLPPEIRERIYTYTLQDTIIPSTMHLYPLSKRRHGLPKPPPLCVCCKQLYLESIKLHWSHSIFLFPTSTNLNAFNLWFTNIGRRRRELISNIYIQKSGLGYNKDRKRQERRDLKENAETGRCWLEKFWEVMRNRGGGMEVLKVILLLPEKCPPKKNFFEVKREVWTAEPEKVTGPYLRAWVKGG